MSTMMVQFVPRICGAMLLLLLALCLTLAGCEKREKVLDVDTPGAEIEIDKPADGDDGLNIDIDTDRK